MPRLVTSVCYSPDGKRALSGSGDSTVKVWDTQTGQEKISLKGHTSGVHSVCYSPDGKRVLSGSWDKTVKVWDAETGQEKLTLKGHTWSVTSVCYSPDGKRVLSGNFDDTVKVWDIDLSPVEWHAAQVQFIQAPDSSFASAFHLERLYRLQPWDAPVRSRLEEALKQAPDSPATQAVRRRLAEHDVARAIRLIGAASSPWTALPLVPLGFPR